MSWKKITAFCLAFVMAAGVSSGLSLELDAAPINVAGGSSRAAGDSSRATTEQAATLAFTKDPWDKNPTDTETRTAVSGTIVNFTETTKAGYAKDVNDNFTWDAQNNAPKPNENGKEDLVIRDAGGNKRRLTISKDYPPDPKGTDVTIMFNGNYYTLRGTGIVIQKPSGQPAIPEENATINPTRVQEFGEIHLRVTRGEQPVDGKPGGVAMGIEIASKEGVFGNVTDVRALRQPDGQLQIELVGVATETGNQSFFFKPYGQYQGYRNPDDENEVTDKDGNKWGSLPGHFEVDDQGNTTTTLLPAPTDTNDVIRKGTEFTLILRKPVSNTLALTIKPPMTAVNEIAERVDASVREDGKKVGMTDSQYITLDPRNSLEFITEDFWLVKKIKDWNAQFDVAWTVGTTNDNGQNVQLEDLLTVVTTSPPPPDDPNAQNEVTQQVILNKEKLPEKNVEGFLSAVVSYTTADGKETFQSDVTIEIPIIVRGKGVKPETVEYQTHNPEGATVIDTALTGNKRLEMDVFQGGIPGYRDPKKPYQYDLNLMMGSGNGWAEYVRIDVEHTAQEETDEEDFTGEEEVVQIRADDAIQQGTSIKLNNPGKQEADVEPKKIALELVAAHKGRAVLTINYGQLTATGEYVDDPALTRIITLDVDNTSPSDDARLKSIVIENQEGKVVGYESATTDPWQFDKDNTGQYIIEVPYTSTGLQFIPTKNHPLAQQTVDILWQAYYLDATGNRVFLNKGDSGDGTDPWSKVKSGNRTDSIGEGITLLFFRQGQPLPDGVPITVTFRTTAQNPTIHMDYILQIIRRSPGVDASLIKVEGYRDGDQEEKTTNLFTPFDGSTLVQKEIYTVPYMTDWIWMSATPSDENAKVEFDPPLKQYKTQLFGQKEWLQLADIPQLENGLYNLKIKVWSEATRYDPLANPDRVYELQIRRADPSKHSGLGMLELAKLDGETVPYTPAVNENTLTYVVKDLPYSAAKLQIKAAQSPDPENPLSTIYKILCVYNLKKPNGGGRKFVDITSDFSIKKAVDIDFLREDELPDVLHLIVVSEAGYGKSDEQIWEAVQKNDPGDSDWFTDYTIEVNRARPSEISDLLNLKVKGKDKADQEHDLSLNFRGDNYDTYYLDVPYSMAKVNFTPFLGQEGQKIWIKSNQGIMGILPGLGNQIKDADTKGSSTSRDYELNRYEDNPQTEFTITVRAEDYEEYNPGHESIYKVVVRRAAPSSDARLRNLTATNVELDELLYPAGLRPPFTASTYDYEATLIAGAVDTVVTATANDANATIEIEEILTPSGVGSDPIAIIYVEQTVTIVVTAEDGVTTETYTITFTNPNMIEKTTNADLKYLDVNYSYMNPDFEIGFSSKTGFGQMTPDFRPATTDYEVVVPEDCYQVEIQAKPADKYATMEIFQGTRSIGDYNGNYSASVQDGENQFSIVVTSSAGETYTKTYNISVFRNDEENMKNLTPLDVEDIDFENSGDVILIAIDEYPRVNANVFAELKKYPEKTIIFQGNDYSIEFKASDLTRVVPQQEIFDFRMFFTTPQEDAIMEIIDRRSSNDDLRGNRIVMMYFPYHGMLPGTATLHLNLGYRYHDDTLYWHYYNEDRERIDYYGSILANSQGTFAVSIDHFSTYIVTRPHYIYGAELMYGVEGNENDPLLNSDFNKVNPWTGVPEENP